MEYLSIGDFLRLHKETTDFDGQLKTDHGEQNDEKRSQNVETASDHIQFDQELLRNIITFYLVEMPDTIAD